MAPLVVPGQILAGKFQVERVLGEGGMGMVVAAQHLQLGQTVALKFLHAEFVQNPTVAERFLREARATVRLKSEHVGRVIDVGTMETGAPYIVMEYLEGCDLEQFLAQHSVLPVVQAVDFVLQASEAVAEAHSLGIVHRDLKPANLFLTARADGGALVKVLDFGISKATNDAQDFSLTRTATVMGSPGYMSPEQLRSAKDVDPRTDVWALGVILYELVNGRPPFAAESITELTLKVAMDAVPAFVVATPAGFVEVVTRCLAKDPAQRFGSVAELAAALVPYGQANAQQQAQRIARVQAGLTTNVIKSAVQPIASVPTTLSASATGTAPPAPRRPWIPIAIAAAVALAAGVAGVVMLGGTSADKPAPAPAPAVQGTPNPTPTPPVPPPPIAKIAVTVYVPVPGATPVEVEAKALQVIEPLLTSTAGVVHVNATAVAGLAVMVAEFEPQVKLEDARAALARTLDGVPVPPGVGTPVVVGEAPAEMMADQDPRQAMQAYAESLKSTMAPTPVDDGVTKPSGGSSRRHGSSKGSSTDGEPTDFSGSRH
ncbi:MAG: protein kinase [Kofleriaceae bacterium]